MVRFITGGITMLSGFIACQGCGHPISDKAISCPKCGEVNQASIQLTQQPSSSEVGGAVSAEVQERLAGHENRTLMTCLNCGYRGPMGVTGTHVPWYSSFWLVPVIAYAGFFIAAFWGVTIALAAWFFYCRVMGVKEIAECPNCMKSGVRS